MFPIKTIDMAECFEVQVRSMDAKASGRFEFKVVTRKEETWFATDTMTERTGWIDALNSLMARAVGASLMNLEAKLNTIRHRNNSLEYAQAGSTDKSALEEQLQLVQQDLASREQLLSQREQDLERKRIDSMLVQLEAWRSAAKVTVNQHYAVRDQLLERVMKTARTVQELLERAKLHLETGSDQVLEITKGHLECLNMHTNDPALSGASFKMIKSIMVGLTVNLDTRSSEMKRALLVIDQYVASARGSSGSLSSSSPASPKASPLSFRDRRMSVGGPMGPSHPPPASSSSSLSVGVSVHLLQTREKYKETLDLLEDHSRRLKRILERTDLSNHESMRKFPGEVRDLLQGLLKTPTYVFAPCLPDQPLPGAADTFYREDLVQIQQMGQEMIKKGQGLYGLSATVQQAVGEMLASPIKRKPVLSSLEKKEDQETGKREFSRPQEKDTAPETSPPTSKGASQLPSSPTSEKSSSSLDRVISPTPLAASFSTPTMNPPLSLLPLPEPLSSFLLPDSSELTQKLRDTILPEFDHISIKQEESLHAMTTLLNQVSSLVVKQLAEIKESNVAQRQEFEELKDEIIDVMQLSATDPSSAQREVSTLSDIRSKLADISGQLAKVQNQSQGQNISNNGFKRVGGGVPSAATATGISLLQRSASTMVHSSLDGPHSFYHTFDNGSLQQLKQSLQPPLFHSSQDLSKGPRTGGAVGGGLAAALSIESASSGRHPKIAGMVRRFEEDDDIQEDHGRNHLYQQQVVSKLDQLMLLLEFVNTAQCRMMAYQDLEYDRKSVSGASIDDGRMMAVQEHMEQADRKLNMQMHLLQRLVSLQGASSTSLNEMAKEETRARVEELEEGDQVEKNSHDINAVGTVSGNLLTGAPNGVLTLVEVLDRLDLQVIPSVKDQSERIYELSDQLSEMKHQLDEQRRRLEQSQNQRPTTPLLHARSPSQPLQQQTTGGTSDLDANPASWRASLRPSNSVGNAHAHIGFRERERTLNNSQRSLASSDGSPVSLQDTFSVSFKTSDRIAEMLDKMDAKLGQVIDEQMTRFEKSNKDMLARVYELLEADDEEEIQQHQDLSKRSLLRESKSKSLVADIPVEQHILALEKLIVSQGERQDRAQHGNEALWTQHTQELKTLLENLAQSHTLSQHRDLFPEDSEILSEETLPSPSTASDWKELLDNIKNLILSESDRTETNLNDQRDELFDKLNEVVSALKEAEVKGSTRDGELKEGLAEIRKWILHNSQMQTDNLREIELSATMGAHHYTGYSPRSAYDDTTSVLEVDAIKDSTGLASHPSSTAPLPPKTSEIQELREQLEMFTKVQMATFSELADNVSGVEKMMRDMSQMMGVRRGGTILRKKEAEAGRVMLAMEVKETIQEVMTRMQPSPSLAHISTTLATIQKGSGAPLSSPRGSIDEPITSTKEGGIGLFKYLYQPRRASSMLTTSTTSVGANPSSALPPLATPTTATATASISGRLVGGRPCSMASSVSDFEEDERDEGTDMDHYEFLMRQKHTRSRQERESLEWYQEHLEQLCRRKILAEIEVENLKAEKDKLQREKDEMQEEVELLRRERQELEQGKERRAESLCSNAASPQWLEQVLADRVAALFKETVRREGLNQQIGVDSQRGPVGSRIESPTRSSPQTPSPHLSH